MTATLLQTLSAVPRIPLLCAALLIVGTGAQPPYNPTRLLHNGSHVYIFRPSSSASSQFELGVIDISSPIESSHVLVTTLYPTLPFLDENKIQPFDAVLDNEGNITVYTGKCSSETRGGEVWSFASEATDNNGNGTWRQQEVAFNQDGKHASNIGPNFLSAGMSFSALVDGDSTETEAYFFGGMCPTDSGDKTDWQANANYSNYMVTLQPSEMNDKSMQYQLGVSTSRGPPIAEAGFSLTGLSPSYSNHSDGTQTQQQNFVLIGGHTSAAFINTSQVALFSLPQQGWTFVPVNQPLQENTAPIESRSGHSAVLSPDGQRVIVFGGWIGDVDTPADPQLAVLNVGNGYGGEGDWEWTIPSTSGLGLASGAGIYGHGAVMLPGGVMMVAGGHSMPPSNSRRRRNTANEQSMFLNISSYTWTTDYSPPPSLGNEPLSNSGSLATTGQKAGLGVGLGVGMAAVLSLMAFYVFYTRKLKRKRELRESQLHELALGAHRYTLSPGFDGRDAHTSYDRGMGESHFYSATSAQNNSGWRKTKAQDAERTGLLVEIPSPTRGLRRSLGGRTSHHTARYDDRRVMGSGNIHPIDEEEEQEQENANDKTPLTSQPEMSERIASNGHAIFYNAPVLDPFLEQHRTHGDNILISAPTSPTRDHRHEDHEEPHSWQAVAGAHLPRDSSPGSYGRISPTKSSERTGSNLSEKSTYSNLSSRSGSGTLGRNGSKRSAAILNSASNTNPFKTLDASPTTDSATRAGNVWQMSAPDPRTRSFTSIRSTGRPGTGNADADSFATARSSFMVLQAEGEALLGGNPEATRPNTSSTSNDSNNQSSHTEDSMRGQGIVTPATSTIEGFTRRRHLSFLGSVRRALARTTSSADRTRSLTTATMDFEAYKDNPEPKVTDDQSILEKRMSMPVSVPPRRAASDASFWRSKRGKQDWLEEEIDQNDPRAKWRRRPGDDWGAPEDLALAEKERLRREWRERGTLLVNLTEDDRLPTPTTPITPGQLGVPTFPDNDHERPRTPADEVEWDVEAAVERRVVQVMFTVPKSKLRVVNADIDASSLLSSPKENNSKESVSEGEGAIGSPTAGHGTPSRVRDLAGKFEQLSSPDLRNSPRMSPKPSPAPSIKSVKLRRNGSVHSMIGKGKEIVRE